MAKQRLKKMVITAMCHYKSVGRVVDKLVREKRISMNAWKGVDLREH